MGGDDFEEKLIQNPTASLCVARLVASVSARTFEELIEQICTLTQTSIGSVHSPSCAYAVWFAEDDARVGHTIVAALTTAAETVGGHVISDHPQQKMPKYSPRSYASLFTEADAKSLNEQFCV